MAAALVVLFICATLSLTQAYRCTDSWIGTPSNQQVPLQRAYLAPPDISFQVTIQTEQFCYYTNGISLHVCDPEGGAPTVTAYPPNVFLVMRNLDHQPYYNATVDAVVYCYPGTSSKRQ